MIPEDVIQEIKQRANIGDVVGRYVKLKRRGKNLVGLCPFHSEKTPSFNVHPDDGYYKCFGCGESGDVFKFVEKQTGQDFPIVVRALAEEVGVEVPQREMNPEQERRQKERAALLKVNERAQLFFRAKLAHDEEGRNARAYLAEARKLDPDIIDQFGLGFGGLRDDGLLESLTRQGVMAEQAVAAGVLREGHSGPYDFFRSRVTFPIRDYRGRILTFAGRIFGPGAHKRPKYVNGPQSPLYDKSSVLYGLYEALPGLKKGRPAVLVEGQVDVIAIWRCGVATGVAPCGTSLTPRHVEGLKRYTSKVVLCLDADAAGQAATERAVLLCLNGGLEVAIAELVEGDPDDMVSEGKGEALAQRIEGAPPALDLYIERAVERSAGSMNARIKALHDLLPFLAAHGADELSRRQYVKRVARAFHEDESFLYDEIAKVGRRGLVQKTRMPAEPRRPQAPRPPAPRPQAPRSQPPRLEGARPQPSAPQRAGAQSQSSQSQGSQSQGAQSQGAQSQGAQSQGAQSQGAQSQRPPAPRGGSATPPLPVAGGASPAGVSTSPPAGVKTAPPRPSSAPAGQAPPSMTTSSGYDPALDDAPVAEPVIYDDEEAPDHGAYPGGAGFGRQMAASHSGTDHEDEGYDERYDSPQANGRALTRVDPPAEWLDAERGLVRALICHPSLAPRCGVLLENMRNHELRRFVADLTDALVRFHTDEPRDVLKKVGAPTEVQRIFAEIYFGGGFDNPAAVFNEGVAAEMIESYVATLERRPLLTKLKELQRGIEAATERGDLETAESMMKSQQVVVAGLRLSHDEAESEREKPRLRLVEPAGFEEGDDPGDAPASLRGPPTSGLLSGRPPSAPAGPVSLPDDPASGDALEPDDIALDEDDFAW